MELVKITELTSRLGISSRTLRYYEQTGLITSVRPAFQKYRYYDAENLSRLKQILVLRKMQIPVKDILQIYESNDMRALVAAFTKRMESIDREINALAELKRVIDEFVSAIRTYGVTRFSALPLMYEEMSKQLAIMQTDERPSGLGALADKPDELSIELLPAMRALSSRRIDTLETDADGLYVYLNQRGAPRIAPGARGVFEYQDARGQTLIMHAADAEACARAPFETINFEGGLCASIYAYADDDIAYKLKQMLASLDDNPYYQVDYKSDGALRHAVLMEKALSPDRMRERVKLYLPVKLRAPDVSLYEEGERVYGARAEDIISANPALWTKRVPMDGFTPVFSPHYLVNDAGEAEFIAYIDKRRLSSNVEVTAPFRVDIEFRVDIASGRFGYGSGEGSVRVYHGEDMYAVNMDNSPDERMSKHALRFRAPIVGEYLTYPRLGDIKPNDINTLTWIVGDAHFAVIINGEVRYCARKLPYMAMDLSMQTPKPILIGSDGQGKRYFRKLSVSQLKRADKINIREGTLMINTKQSNNRVPIIHRLITLHYGENYWFNGAAKYVMECLGEKDLDYWLFAGVTGDVLAQVYAKDHFRGDGATDYMLSDPENRHFAEQVFARVGYAATYLSENTLKKNMGMYINTLMAYIDRGVPVMRYHYGWGVLVGYEDYGKTLLWLTADNEEPEAIPADKLFELPENITPDDAENAGWGWVFAGDKQAQTELKQIYRNAVINMPGVLSVDTPTYCFGARAFRMWADSIDGGFFDGMRPERFDDWAHYKIYVCNLATNASCSHIFLKKALEYNPDMTFLNDICAIYKRMEGTWKDGERNLEALGGGFNVTLDALQDPGRRAPITSLIREFADYADDIMALLKQNIKQA